MALRLAARSLAKLARGQPQTAVLSRSLTHYPVNDQIFGLDEEKQKLRETAFNFFQKELAPFAKDIDKNDDFPWVVQNFPKGIFL